MIPPPVLGADAGAHPLVSYAHGAAKALTARGIGPGMRIAVLGDGGPRAVLGWLLGADLLGVATLVVEPKWSGRERAAVLHDARPDLIVDGAPEAAAEPARGVPVGDRHTPFYLATTSGSSARPKVLLRTRDSWLRSFAALGPVPGPVLVPGALSSSLFLFGALHALWSGVEPQLRPRLHVANARAAGTVHLVPAMLADLLDRIEHDGTGPGGPRTVVCGGAHVGAALRERFARVLPDAELIEYYGSAEHSLIALRRSGQDALCPVPGVDLEVRDDDLLWVRSPLAFLGYLRSGALNRAAPWTTAGDRCELAADGALTVHGRGSATISSGGRLVSAEEVEAVLLAVPGVEDVLVTGTPHSAYGALVTAVIQARRPPSLRALRAAARAALEPGKRPRRWLLTDALPRTASGKPARASVTEQLAAGTFPARPLW